jgi:uncharacterized membrane-anchored protein
MALGALAISTSSASEKEYASWNRAAMRETELYGIDPEYVKTRMEGRDINLSELGRTWKDWLLIAAATLIFVGFAALAKVPHMEIQTAWLGLFAVLLVTVLGVGGVALWRITKFT